jgi:hypothetical protein
MSKYFEGMRSYKLAHELNIFHILGVIKEQGFFGSGVLFGDRITLTQENLCFKKK